MSAEITSKFMQYRSMILRAFSLEHGLELSMPDIRDRINRIKKISEEDVYTNTLGIPILDLIKENFLTSRNGPPHPSKQEERSGENDRGHIKLFSIKPAV